MNSWLAICASVRPSATRLTSYRSRVLSWVRPGGSGMLADGLWAGASATMRANSVTVGTLHRGGQ